MICKPKGEIDMGELIELNKEIVILRNKLNNLLSDLSLIDRDIIIEYSQRLDELITRYHILEKNKENS